MHANPDELLRSIRLEIPGHVARLRVLEAACSSQLLKDRAIRVRERMEAIDSQKVLRAPNRGVRTEIQEAAVINHAHRLFQIAAAECEHLEAAFKNEATNTGLLL